MKPLTQIIFLLIIFSSTVSCFGPRPTGYRDINKWPFGIGEEMTADDPKCSRWLDWLKTPVVCSEKLVAEASMGQMVKAAWR